MEFGVCNLILSISEDRMGEVCWTKLVVTKYYAEFSGHHEPCLKTEGDIAVHVTDKLTNHSRNYRLMKGYIVSKPRDA